MKTKNIIAILTLLIICMVTTTSYAVDITEITNHNWNSDIDSDIDQIRGNVIAVIQVIGVSVALVMLVAVAIKYLTAAPNEKADVKKHAIPYVVGAIFIFGSVRNNTTYKTGCRSYNK